MVAGARTVTGATAVTVVVPVARPAARAPEAVALAVVVVPAVAGAEVAIPPLATLAALIVCTIIAAAAVAT
jgi:hypothetical protein